MLCISLRMKIARDGLLCVMRFPRYLTVPGRLICLQLVASGKKWLTAFLQQRRGAFRVGWICKYQMFVRILKPFLDLRIPQKRHLKKNNGYQSLVCFFFRKTTGPFLFILPSCTRNFHLDLLEAPSVCLFNEWSEREMARDQRGLYDAIRPG